MKNPVVDKDLTQLLRHCDNADLDPIVSIILAAPSQTLTLKEAYRAHTGDHKAYVDEIVYEITSFGGNSLANLFRGQGVPYADMVRDVASYLGVKPTVNDTTSLLEEKIILKVLKLSYDRLGEDDRLALQDHPVGQHRRQHVGHQRGRRPGTDLPPLHAPAQQPQHVLATRCLEPVVDGARQLGVAGRLAFDRAHHVTRGACDHPRDRARHLPQRVGGRDRVRDLAGFEAARLRTGQSRAHGVEHQLAARRPPPVDARLAGAGARRDVLDGEAEVADLGQLVVGRLQDRVLERGPAPALHRRRTHVVGPSVHPRHQLRTTQIPNHEEFTSARLRSLSSWS